MRAPGNGTPRVCANNLLQITRGEVPFERVKGLDPRMYDRPHSIVDAEIQQDAEWLLETYEPRVEVNAIIIEPTDTVSGGFAITADINETEE